MIGFCVGIITVGLTLSIVINPHPLPSNAIDSWCNILSVKYRTLTKAVSQKYPIEVAKLK
jgi:hypothetical protein